MGLGEPAAPGGGASSFLRYRPLLYPRIAAVLLTLALALIWLRKNPAVARWRPEAPASASIVQHDWGAAAQAVRLNAQLPDWAQCGDPPCNYGNLADGAVDSGVPWSSQFYEDHWLYNNLFYGKRDGFFLELGAMDGVLYSNTRWFARAAGWRGLLIEACPEQYANLTRNRADDSICLHAAVCSDFRTVHFHSDGGVGGIFEFFAQDFREGWHPNLTIDALPEVPCVPLQFVLDKYGIASIDLWSLDVEGAELEVLRTVDFTRLQVGVLIVETDGHNATKDGLVGELLAAAGFDTVDLGPDKRTFTLAGMNTVFVHGEAWERLGLRAAASPKAAGRL